MGTVIANDAKALRRWQASDRQAVKVPGGDWAGELARMAGQRAPGAPKLPPSDSPLHGMTADSLRSEIAAMRAAEMERSRVH